MNYIIIKHTHHHDGMQTSINGKYVSLSAAKRGLNYRVKKYPSYQFEIIGNPQNWFVFSWGA